MAEQTPENPLQTFQKLADSRTKWRGRAKAAEKTLGEVNAFAREVDLLLQEDADDTSPTLPADGQ